MGVIDSWAGLGLRDNPLCQLLPGLSVAYATMSMWKRGLDEKWNCTGDVNHFFKLSIWEDAKFGEHAACVEQTTFVMHR